MFAEYRGAAYQICEAEILSADHSVSLSAEILLSQRHSTAGTGAASVGKHMGMVLMYSPAVIASLQYHLPWLFGAGTWN